MDLVMQGLESSGALPTGDKAQWEGKAVSNPAASGPLMPRGIHAMLHPDGSCRGYGFVNFQEEAAAQHAIQTLNGAMVSDGSVLSLRIKRAKGEQEGGADGSGGWIHDGSFA